MSILTKLQVEQIQAAIYDCCTVLEQSYRYYLLINLITFLISILLQALYLTKLGHIFMYIPFKFANLIFNFLAKTIV